MAVIAIHDDIFLCDGSANERLCLTGLDRYTELAVNATGIDLLF